ncbi:MAG: MFS transporter, partial [Chloroflexi bacterium]|nr:MFS transporter [Chloroflexota bacterium]
MLSYVSGAFDRFRTPPATREDQNIRRLMLQTALAGVVNGGIATFLPIFLVRLGATPVTVSLLTALPALLTILFSLPAGALVARWTRLVPPSARWYYGLRFCYLAVAIVGLLDPTWAPALIIVIWGLSAVPSTFANTAWYSVLAEAVSPRRRPAVNGVRWALLGLISAASVAAFGQLLETLPFPGNYLLVFVLSFAAGILNVWFYSQIEIPDRPFPPVSPSPLPLRAQAAEL